MSHKFTIQLEVFPETEEHRTHWLPPVSREAALMFLDRALRSAAGHLQHVTEIRAIVDATPQPSDPKEGK